MKLALAALCEYANQTRDGNLNLMGIFDRLVVPSLPAIKAQIFLALQLRLEEEDYQTTQVLRATLHRVDSGQEIIRLELPVFNRERRPGDRGIVNSLIGIGAIVFDRVGDYRFRVAVGDTISADLPLEVRLVSELGERTGGSSQNDR
jgi:hypothetical protein